MTTHKWLFAPRFKRKAFGWQSDTAILRIKEALAEIKLIAKEDACLAAEGAVLLLEKLVPAIEGVDSSSGAIGSTVFRAIETLVPLIAKAPASPALRQRWLERLWQAKLDDGISYLDSLGDHWGTLCTAGDANTEVNADGTAARWVAELLPQAQAIWQPAASQHYYTGTTACLSAMYAAQQHEALLDLLAMAPYKMWHYRQWGVRALLALGRQAEALQYAQDSRGLNESDQLISQTCEEILLASGLAGDSAEAYARYAVVGNQASTYLATFRAIAKKYPHKAPADILRDLVASTPGEAGKWFAAAKSAGLFSEAIALVAHSPTDPRTLTRAARDHAQKQPQFALDAAKAALHWMACGFGYEITGAEVVEAFEAALGASRSLGRSDDKQTVAEIRAMLTGPAAPASAQRVARILERELAE